MRVSLTRRARRFQTSNNPRQFLQGAPVFEAFLFGFVERLARVAVLVEVFGEAAFGARNQGVVSRCRQYPGRRLPWAMATIKM